VQRPRISHAHRRWRAHSHMFHGCRGCHERQLRACACRGGRVVASHVTRVHMQQTGREGRLKSKIFRPAGPQAQPSAILSTCRARCVGELGYPLRSTEVQRGAFMVYLMFDVIKGQFGRTVVIL